MLPLLAALSPWRLWMRAQVDLRGSRAVDAEEGAAYAREAGLTYVETSAKEAINVDRLFVEVARRVPRTASTPAGKGGGGTVPLGGGAAAGGGGGSAGKPGCGCG